VEGGARDILPSLSLSLSPLFKGAVHGTDQKLFGNM
jgi:hypothetical protein